MKKTTTMNIKKSYSIITLLSLCLLGFFAGEVFAQTPEQVKPSTTSTTTAKSLKIDAKTQARIDTAKKRAVEEIDRRITAMNNLDARIAQMIRVTTAEKAQFSASIQGQITSLNDLKSKIMADTDLETLKTDIKSIATSYRIFALVIPQGHIMATADSVMTAINTTAALGVKLETRIKELEAAGKDTKALVTQLTDISTKITNAKSQIESAFIMTSALVPDGGDKDKMKTNQETLKSARAKIKVARADLEDARKSARKIVAELKKIDLTVGSGAATTTSR